MMVSSGSFDTPFGASPCVGMSRMSALSLEVDGTEDIVDIALSYMLLETELEGDVVLGGSTTNDRDMANRASSSIDELEDVRDRGRDVSVLDELSAKLASPEKENGCSRGERLLDVSDIPSTLKVRFSPCVAACKEELFDSFRELVRYRISCSDNVRLMFPG